MGDGTLVIGGGQAGLQVAASLRAGGYGEPIRIVGEERHPPYQRPPLSKAVLSGEAGMDTVPLRAPAFYADNGIDLVTGVRVGAIDPAARTATAGGQALRFDRLVIATGADVRKLPVPGAELDGVLYLRGLDDALALKGRIAPGLEMAVVGGGFIGLEVAASATKLGCKVTVLEALPRVLMRSVAPVMSDAIVARHRAKGVTVRTGASVARIAGANGRVTGVELADGSLVPCGLVVVGIGVVPADGFARAAGLAAENGLVVDTHLRTNHDNIFAIGDVAQFPTRFAPRPVRLESVQNAIDQGKAVANAILGKPEPYDAVPWFWSDQFDMKLQTTGLAIDVETVAVRGEPESGAFSLRGGRLVAVDSLNKPADHMAGRRLVGMGARLTPAEIADPAFDLKRAALAAPA